MRYDYLEDRFSSYLDVEWVTVSIGKCVLFRSMIERE